MKKKVLLFVSLIICCFSFMFAGCSVFDDSDKKLFNQIYDQFASFVDSQKKSNEELLKELDEIKNELNQEKHSQNDLTVILREKLVLAAFAIDQNVVVDTKVVSKDKEMSQKFGLLYNKNDKSYKSFYAIYSEDYSIGEFINRIYNNSKGCYLETRYDLKTGSLKDSQYLDDSTTNSNPSSGNAGIVSSGSLSGIVTPPGYAQSSMYYQVLTAYKEIYSKIITINYLLEGINNSGSSITMNDLGDGKVQFLFRGFSNDAQADFDIRDIAAFNVELVFENDKLIELKTESCVSTSVKEEILRSIEDVKISYVENLNMEDYMIVD